MEKVSCQSIRRPENGVLMVFRAKPPKATKLMELARILLEAPKAIVGFLKKSACTFPQKSPRPGTISS